MMRYIILTATLSYIVGLIVGYFLADRNFKDVFNWDNGFDDGFEAAKQMFNAIEKYHAIEKTCTWIVQKSPLTKCISCKSSCGYYLSSGRTKYDYKYCPYCGGRIEELS